MKTPPLLVGAALVFWGWQTDFLYVGLVMAVLLEGARFLKSRWEPSNEDFTRIWTFCTLLFLAALAYAFTASDGPTNVRVLFANGPVSSTDNVGTTTTKTAVLLIRWLPMIFFLFIAAQAFGRPEGIPLEAISLILRRRWKRAQKSGRPAPNSRPVDVAYPYFITCLFAASAHAKAENDAFFWGLCALTAWALWPQRSRRFGWAPWAGAMAAVVVLGYGGEHGLMRLQRALGQYNPQWLFAWLHHGADPLESRTQIGQIGRIKTSQEIIIRLETRDDRPPPQYLREAAYRSYNASGVWYAGSSKDDFVNVTEMPYNSGKWSLLPGRTNRETVSIACYLPGKKALLPLPEETGRLMELPAYLLQRNGVGAVRAEGPGLVVFNALYDNGASIDSPPDTNEDLAVPDREKPALERVVAELNLDSLSPTKKLETVRQFFASKFNYSLWQDVPRYRGTNNTPLSRFLLETRTGHCEYFATATVLLLRQAGIRARYTVGFAVHEASSGNKYVVRENDAHAWCRVYSDRDKRWEDFDTTPGSWEATEKNQRSAFQFILDGWSWVQFQVAKFRWGQSHYRQYILWILIPVLVLLLYQIIFRSGRRRHRHGSNFDALGRVRPGLDSEFYQLEGELAKRGLERHASEPLSIWVERVGKVGGLPEFNQSMRQIVSLHYRYRFDPQGLKDGERETLRREVAECLSRMIIA